MLLYIGIKALNENPEVQTELNKINKLHIDYLSTLGLTITNPATILTFLAIYSSFGFTDINSYLDSSLIVTGILIGSAIWWLFLSFIVSIFKNRINPND